MYSGGTYFRNKPKPSGVTRYCRLRKKNVTYEFCLRGCRKKKDCKNPDGPVMRARRTSTQIKVKGD